MIETARLFARYNAHVNTEMNKVLSTLAAEDWTKDRGGHFSSFQSMAGHIYTADVHWMVRFTGLRPFQAVKGDPFDFPPSWDKPPFGAVAEYAGLRRTLDQAIEAFTQELTEADMKAPLAYRNSRGDAFTKNFGGLVFHMFNHQTHHRGMVALYLDQMGVKNDFSNLNAIVES